MYNCCTTVFKNCAEINSRKFMFCKFRLEILPSNSCVWNSKLFFHIFMDWNLTENWKPYSDWKTSCSLMASLPRGQQVGIKNWRLHLDIGNHFFVSLKSPSALICLNHACSMLTFTQNESNFFPGFDPCQRFK